MAKHYNQIAGGNHERLAALSDGLFAIAMTLLILDLKVPEGTLSGDGELAGILLALFPRFVTFLMSFLTLGIFWVGQQTQLNQLVRADRDFTWINLAFLALVAVVPFSTALLASHIHLRSALLFYWLNILLLGVVILASWSYACRANLLGRKSTEGVYHAVRRRVLVAQAYYAFGAALCVFGTAWSIAFIVLVQLNYAFAPKFTAKWTA
ncbi:MAG TPA: TMEM175 family protein [bacterium]|nr:TMEM175 family protein [bacterium]